ncbi:hypothetical protein ACIBF6_02255 [Streptosporangium amethystogenes]|uniref:hypothetical protein n=1 Tax=Streptosporangium amethystogenes TaxID=2002 RepID=UPI0037996B52
MNTPKPSTGRYAPDRRADQRADRLAPAGPASASARVATQRMRCLAGFATGRAAGATAR